MAEVSIGGGVNREGYIVIEGMVVGVYNGEGAIVVNVVLARVIEVRGHHVRKVEVVESGDVRTYIDYDGNTVAHRILCYVLDFQLQRLGVGT